MVKPEELETDLLLVERLVKAATSCSAFSGERVAVAAVREEAPASQGAGAVMAATTDQELLQQPLPTARDSVEWGQCELRPFVFGLQQLVMAAAMPELVPLDDVLEVRSEREENCHGALPRAHPVVVALLFALLFALLQLIEAVEGVSSVEVRNSRRVDGAE